MGKGSRVGTKLSRRSVRTCTTRGGRLGHTQPVKNKMVSTCRSMTYYTKLPWLAVGPLAFGQTSVDDVGVCTGSNVKLINGKCIAQCTTCGGDDLSGLNTMLNNMGTCVGSDPLVCQSPPSTHDDTRWTTARWPIKNLQGGHLPLLQQKS